MAGGSPHAFVLLALDLDQAEALGTAVPIALLVVAAIAVLAGLSFQLAGLGNWGWWVPSLAALVVWGIRRRRGQRHRAPISPVVV